MYVHVLKVITYITMDLNLFEISIGIFYYVLIRTAEAFTTGSLENNVNAY